jgi:hypothetical protein
MIIVFERASSRGPLAMGARNWFAEHGPPDLQPLPLGYSEREALKDGHTARHILAWYSRSLADLRYDFQKHPSFYDYACGVMASRHTLRWIAENPELQKRFPPRPLEWLDDSFYWRPPKRPRGRPRRATKDQHGSGSALTV